MPTNEYLYPAVYDCVFNNSYTRTNCPPVKTNCIPMDLDCLWVAEEEDTFNCNLCGADERFFIPYFETDQIMFQTQLSDQINVNPFFPVFGWAGDTVTAAFRAQLLDGDGNVVSSDITQFATSYMVAHTPITDADATPYQQFILDLNAVKNTFGLSCFMIRVNSFVDTGGGPAESAVVYSQTFQEAFCQDDPTLFTNLVRGKFPRFDCCGNWYGLPQKSGPFTFWSVGNEVFEFDNTLRYYSNFTIEGSNTVKESFDNSITKSTITDQYELHLMEMIPPYMFNIFTKWHYGARQVCINGEEYDTTGDLAKETPPSTTMFLFSAGFTKDCENSFTCT